MDSSNRFAPLGEPSSSKEQEAQVPRTSTEDTSDQTMQGTDQPSLPADGGNMSTAGLVDTRSPSTDELVKLFMERGAKLLEEEEERKKNSRKRSSSRYVKEPIPSAAPPQGVRNQTASFDEAERPSKRRRLGPISPSQAVEEPDTPTPKTASDSKTEEPNVAMGGDPAASALAVPEASVLSPPSTFRWADIRNPSEPLLCMAQANDSRLLGSFAENTEDWAFTLTFDAGRRRIPTMSMRFFSHGLLEPPCGQTGWCLGDYIEGDWMVTDFNIHRVADCPEDENKGICNCDVLAACKTDEEKARLICISLKAWPKIIGPWKTANLQSNPKPGIKKFFSNVLTGRHPYQLRIWFVAPHDLERFEKRCLSFFTRYFEQRNVPHDDLYDVDGVDFADHLNVQEEPSST